VKRHPALAELSRDHHHALVVARELRRTTPARAARAAARFLRFWDADGEAHFRLEEEILLPAYAVHGDPRHPAVVQTLIEHMTIRRDAALIAQGAPVEILQRLGEQLAAHVRLEERQVFPLIERTLTEVELDGVGVDLAAAMLTAAPGRRG
jgi:Hemerythrin HHE cation binding domain